MIASSKMQAPIAMKPAPVISHSNLLQRKCACGGTPGPSGECEECRKKHLGLQRSAINHAELGEVPSIVFDVLRSPGQPLDQRTREFMEPRFGHDFGRMPTHAAPANLFPPGLRVGAPHDRFEDDAETQSDRVMSMSGEIDGDHYDFSSVRIHTDSRAAESARAVNAWAYTVGPHVVFGDGQYAPTTGRGARLLCHELTHVVQQGAISQPALVQREGMGDVRLAEAIEELLDKTRATPAFKALSPDDVKLTEEIIAEVRKKPKNDQYHFLSKLKVLFDTPVKPPATISVETQAATTTAAAAEKTRLAKPAAAKKTKLEETASAAPKRNWVPIKGKFGGGTYYVDRTSPSNLVVKADIQLTPKGTGTQKDVDEIKSMEDGIEKAASTRGYLVDIRFVNSAAADTFKVDVDPSKWEVATNWSGGDPVGFAHELHHMFAFELDRYNYIESHSSNESMEVHDRLYWFRQELKKPPNYNDPTSIMDSASHPNDDDACRVAGLDIKTCVPARVAARAVKKP